MTKLVVKDWKQDVVYLIQFPRPGCIPSVSPFSLKLETWLRIVGLNYQNINNNFTLKSERGQVPFIEVNGRQIADSNLIIQELIKTFNLKIDQHLSEKDVAKFNVYTAFLEDSLFWSVVFFRSTNVGYFVTEKGFIGHFTGIKKALAKAFLVRQFQKMIKAKANAQGIGRAPAREVVEETKKKFKALSTFLGGKKYLLGDKISSLDATAFGHLTQFYYTPVNKELKDYLDSDCKNIVHYIHQLKEEYWSDWDECTAMLSLETRNVKP